MHTAQIEYRWRQMGHSDGRYPSNAGTQNAYSEGLFLARR